MLPLTDGWLMRTHCRHRPENRIRPLRNVRSLEIDAASVLFPVSIASRLRTRATTDFARLGRLLMLPSVSFALALIGHSLVGGQ